MASGRLPGQRVVPLGRDTDGNPHEFTFGEDGGLVVSGGGAGGGAATIADGADVTQGAKADAAQIDATQTASGISLWKGILSLIAARLGIGVNNLASTTVSVPTTVGGTEIVSARSLRKFVTIMNLSSTVVYIGTGSVDNTYFQLPGVVGAFVSIPTTTAVKGLSASGTVSVSVLEGWFS